MQHPLTPAQARAPFTFTPDSAGGGYLVTYRRAKYGLSTLLTAMLYMAVASLLPCAFARSTEAWVVCTFVVPTVLFLLFNTSRMKRGSFYMTPGAFVVSGGHHDRARIHGLFTKMPFERERMSPVTSTTSGFVIGFGGGDRVQQIGMGAAVAMTAGVAVAAQALGGVSRGAVLRLKAQYARNNVSIGFLYGRKKRILASELSEVDAQLLLNKIAELSSTNANNYY